MSDSALEIVEQKEIEFYGDAIVAVRDADGKIYVPVRPICDLIGVDWAAQRKRINRDPVLSRHFVVVTTTKKGRGNPNMGVLPLEKMNGWLFGITALRIKDEVIRERLIRYQEECYSVLFQAFGRNEVAVRPDDELMQSDSPSAVAFRHAMAIAKIARQQYYFEKRLDNHEQRIQLIEANLGNDKRFVTKEQASHISQGVRAIGTVLSKRSGKNEYGGVYGELYRQWSISSYKEIPAVKYDDVVAWLRNWYLELVDETDVPF